MTSAGSSSFAFAPASLAAPPFSGGRRVKVALPSQVRFRGGRFEGSLRAGFAVGAGFAPGSVKWEAVSVSGPRSSRRPSIRSSSSPAAFRLKPPSAAKMRTGSGATSFGNGGGLSSSVPPAGSGAGGVSGMSSCDVSIVSFGFLLASS